ncbi:MAG: peptidyl-tRNA hydrolase [Patescibacteria group bacterium]|nr:MAG: peptidyl-tRNA hydrolase [Patescibacteria group bacterium]
MKLIVGLGNYNEKYKNNRHNVGFVFIDFIVKELGLGVDFEKNSKFESLVLKTPDLILAKPLTFMNNSGRAVKRLFDYYEIDFDDFYLVYDDLDIALGEYKIVKDKPPKTHNGVWSVIESLGGSDFWHIRIGVENRDKDNRILGEQYVLENFLDNEKEVIRSVISKASRDLIERIHK